MVTAREGHQQRQGDDALSLMGDVIRAVLLVADNSPLLLRISG
jgi:hypothetical protein